MAKEKIICSLELGTKNIKLAIGYSLKGSPVLLYYKKFPSVGLSQEAKIADSNLLSDTLKNEISKISDPATGFRLEPRDISLVLPPLGFGVYQISKATNVVGNDNIIANIDIQNVMSLVNKERLPDGSSIVDIVPDYFGAGGKKWANPPLGQQSGSISVFAKVHALPTGVISSYQKAVLDAGFRISRKSVSSYAASQLIACFGGYPESYTYVDIGHYFTTVSFVGRNSPLRSLYFRSAGLALSEKIASSLDIPLDVADKLKETYGYNPTNHLFEMPIYSKDNLDGTKRNIYQKDLDAAIKEHFDTYNRLLTNALARLKISKDDNGQAYKSFPLIIGGGTSLLKGIDSLLDVSLDGQSIYRHIPNVVGARDPSAINVLGAIAAEGTYKGSLEDNYRGVSPLSRETD